MGFPEYRPRRLRRTQNLRRMIRETRLSVDNLLLPLFVRFGKGIKKEISSMPGNFQVSPDVLVEEVEQVASLGIPAIMLFGIPERKDAVGSGAYAEDGIVQQAVRAVKAVVPELIVVADTCLCEYTNHGHCGVLTEIKGEKYLDNDRTLELLAKTAVSQAASGADVVAPSAMIDGQVQAIRENLDEAGFDHIPIMSYAAKYASAFYGPFREAAESPPRFGDRRSHQMDPANSDEALREVALDIEEGADIVMVKPALAYLDVIYRVKQEFGYPVAAYNVSGEFAAIKAASQKGWLDEKRIVLEVLTAIKRAGADIILTYFAKDVARWLKES